VFRRELSGIPESASDRCTVVKPFDGELSLLRDKCGTRGDLDAAILDTHTIGSQVDLVVR